MLFIDKLERSDSFTKKHHIIKDESINVIKAKIGTSI